MDHYEFMVENDVLFSLAAFVLMVSLKLKCYVCANLPALCATL